MAANPQCLRIGCVPYLNAKPLIAWFHTKACSADVDIAYAVPSELAVGLRDGSLEVALVSTFELFRNPSLVVVPDISVSADGPVKSVRLFSRVPFDKIESVALDTSSLTSTALIRILLSERYGREPRYTLHPPDVDAMLRACDAGLLIGDLKLFDSPASNVMDLGEEWKAHTGFPFVYAAWLAREEAADESMTTLLTQARDWGIRRLGALAGEWAAKLSLPLTSVQDYFDRVMQYDLDSRKWEALTLFQQKCLEHGIITELAKLRRIGG